MALVERVASAEGGHLEERTTVFYNEFSSGAMITSMFSRADLANQQLRNTGTKRLMNGTFGQNIWNGKKVPVISYKTFIIYTSNDAFIIDTKTYGQRKCGP